MMHVCQIPISIETKLKLFLASPEPRSPRQPTVQYRIGQVIRHKIWGYRGVIVGWDPKCRVSDLKSWDSEAS